jgi:hypothetical protein
MMFSATFGAFQLIVRLAEGAFYVLAARDDAFVVPPPVLPRAKCALLWSVEAPPWIVSELAAHGAQRAHFGWVCPAGFDHLAKDFEALRPNFVQGVSLRLSGRPSSHRESHVPAA